MAVLFSVAVSYIQASSRVSAEGSLSTRHWVWCLHTHTHTHTHKTHVSRRSPSTNLHPLALLTCPAVTPQPQIYKANDSLFFFFSDLQVISFNLGTIRDRSRRHLILIRGREMARGAPSPGPSLHTDSFIDLEGGGLCVWGEGMTHIWG